MSNGNKGKPSRSGKSARRGHRSGERPRPAPSASPAAPTSEPSAPRLEGPPGVVLERLRDRIHDVVRELDALRQENHRLSQQLVALQDDGDGGESSLLRLDEPPEALRDKIEGFVKALDTYLEGEEH